MTDSDDTGDRPPGGPGSEPVSPEPPPVGSLEVNVEEGPPLEADTLEEFLAWAAAVPVGAVESIKGNIAAARDRDDDALVEALSTELWRLPVDDVPRHMVLLATIGELRDPRLRELLSDFVWYSPLVHERLQERPDGCSFEARPDEMLQARAAEMLSYLTTDESDRDTLRVALEHPSMSVRAAAIDAHLYNHGDDEDEIERLRSTVRSEDAPLVGVPRFTRDGDPEEFERAVEDYYRRNPEQRAPELHAGPGPADRSTTNREAGDV
jgi:hypothetical protein